MQEDSTDRVFNIPKYAKPEIERRWLVNPDQVRSLIGGRVRRIEDKYLSGTRLRLRKISEEGCAPLFKLGKKYPRVNREPEQVVTIYLNEEEYHALHTLPGWLAIKNRYSVCGGSLDLYEKPADRPAIFEIDFTTEQLFADYHTPEFVGKEVTFDSTYSGFTLAKEPSAQPRTIEIAPYDPTWPEQFAAVAAEIRQALGEHALAIEHVGSTSVPGLGAKDIIDVQVSVAQLEPRLIELLEGHGFRGRTDLCDLFEGIPAGSPELAKYYAREPSGKKRVHIHIREVGRFNHRFALLFRDFLRADDNARDQYLESKVQAAKAYPHDIDGYLALKAPVFHLLYRMADQWARKRAGRMGNIWTKCKGMAIFGESINRPPLQAVLLPRKLARNALPAKSLMSRGFHCEFIADLQFLR